MTIYIFRYSDFHVVFYFVLRQSAVTSHLSASLILHISLPFFAPERLGLGRIFTILDLQQSLGNHQTILLPIMADAHNRIDKAMN